MLEDDRLTEIFVERHRHRGLVGNVYKGRVTRVLPGMQAAFVDIGLERDAFLYVSDVVTRRRARRWTAFGAATSAAPGGRGRRDDGDHRGGGGQSPSIDDLLKPGQEIIVQVIKDPLPTRARGSRARHAARPLPGPAARLGHLGVSRRIEDEAERERLRALLAERSRRPAG